LAQRKKIVSCTAPFRQPEVPGADKCSAMKLRHVALIVFSILLIDQALKIYVKTHYSVSESHDVIGSWFKIHFIENEGMAWGMKFHSSTFGKIALTTFRLGAILFGFWYIPRIIRQQYKPGFIICVALIFSGALGNLIDSMFYGSIFDKGMSFDAASGQFLGYDGVAKFSGDGYSTFMKGNVVDVLYFPVLKGNFPAWFPFWGGKPFEFFNMIFNIADASICIGVITLLVFQKRFLRKNTPAPVPATVNPVSANEPLPQEANELNPGI
jgi:signal peptidase II